VEFDKIGAEHAAFPNSFAGKAVACNARAIGTCNWGYRTARLAPAIRLLRGRPTQAGRSANGRLPWQAAGP